MAEPAHAIPPGAAGGSHLRASHADRDRSIDLLKAAFVQGLLAKDEFDLRVGHVLASRTYGDLAAVTGDLPAGLTSAPPPEPVPRPDTKTAIRLFAGVTAAFPSVMFAEALVESRGLTAATALAAALFAALVAAPAAGLLMMVLLRLERRARSLSWQGPLACPAGQASRDPAVPPGPLRGPGGPLRR